MQALLVTKASGKNFSLEAGFADGEKNFDHHREHSSQPAPSNDNRVPVVGVDDVVEISHIDADTFVGLLRMSGRELPQVDFALMERIDLNGSSVCPDKFNPTLLYMVGVGQIARDLKFPRASAEGPTDVTAFVEAIMAKTEAEIIATGRAATEKSEAAYGGCCEGKVGRVGYWVIGPDDPLDPSRPYEGGVAVVVVHRTHYESISIYCDPKSEYVFGGKVVAGIEFAGHPKAAGSPRGVKFSAEDGRRVFDEIVEMVN